MSLSIESGIDSYSEASHPIGVVSYLRTLLLFLDKIRYSKQEILMMKNYNMPFTICIHFKISNSFGVYIDVSIFRKCLC